MHDIFGKVRIFFPVFQVGESEGVVGMDILRVPDWHIVSVDDISVFRDDRQEDSVPFVADWHQTTYE